MGCLSSKEAIPPAGGVKVGHLTAAQFAAREKHSRTTAVTVPLPGGGSFTLRYAWSSVRGFYPDAPAKKNQDSVLVAPRFQGAASDHAFAVLDGHGETGEACVSQLPRHGMANAQPRRRRARRLKPRGLPSGPLCRVLC